MDRFCYLKENCRCQSHQNPDFLFCVGCECELHDLCGDYDEDGHIWCFTCSYSGCYKVGTLLKKNHEDYLEETLQTVQALSPTKPISTSTLLLEAGDATTTTNSCSNVARALAAELDTSFTESGSNMDTQSIIEIDEVTNYPILMQGKIESDNSDSSSVIFIYAMAHYIAAIEGTDKLLVYPFLGAHRVELVAKELSLYDFYPSFNVEQRISLQLDTPCQAS
jgi:hypothetical protein